MGRLGASAAPSMPRTMVLASLGMARRSSSSEAFVVVLVTLRSFESRFTMRTVFTSEAALKLEKTHSVNSEGMTQIIDI